MAPSTILLIDDDWDSMVIYSLILRHNGFTVLEALDSATGLQLAVQGKPDIVISETFLPGEDGTSFLELLQKRVLMSGIPLIVLDSTPALGRGDTGFAAKNRLTKPCEPSVLLEEVKRLLEDRPTVA
jgi:DNA-binding response OmpR family regulator